MNDLIAWFRAALDDAWPVDVLRVEDERARADIAAKRAVLDAYEEAVAYYGLDGPGRYAPAGEVTGLWTAVQHLAAAYAHLPGYRDEWRPQ